MNMISQTLAQLEAVQNGQQESAAATIIAYKELFTGNDIQQHTFRLAQLSTAGYPLHWEEEKDEKGNVVVPKDREPYWDIYAVLPNQAKVHLCGRASSLLKRGVEALIGLQGGL